MIDALLAGVSADPEPVAEELMPVVEEVPEEEPIPMVEESIPVVDVEPVSTLAQLMADMEKEGGDSSNNGSEDDFMSEAGIEALLSAAQNTEDDLYNDQILSFDINDDTDMDEIEALLNMAENDQPMDETTS